jgi:hypothetical protein
VTLELTASQKSQLWKSGHLFWKLHAGQLAVHQKLRAWEADSLAKRIAGVEIPGQFPRVFVLDCSRRFGKDYLSLCVAVENAIKRPGSVLTYATAFAKDLNEYVLPLMDLILADCPDSQRALYRTSHQGTTNGFYFPNKSVIKLVGVEARPNALRGRFSDGVFFSEAGFIGKLDEALVRVVMPQLQGRLHATVIMNSTPPVAPATFWDTEICPDAQERGAYVLRTIDDNPMLTASERAEFIRAAGGPDSENTLREYYCKRIRSATDTVVPEFSRASNVFPVERPTFAHAFTVIDPGIRDMCAVVCGYYDFERAKLVIRNAWQQRNANTNQVVAAIRDLEEKTFNGLQFWSNRTKGFQNNPLHRYSDTEARLILDLKSLHGIQITPVDKSEGKIAALQRFRTGIQVGDIEFHPDAEKAIASVEAAIWNKERSDWARSDAHGHFDLLDACIYANLSANKIDCPLPPRGVVLSQTYTADQLMLPQSSMERKRPVLDKWSKLFAKRRFVTNGRR